MKEEISESSVNSDGVASEKASGEPPKTVESAENPATADNVASDENKEEVRQTLKEIKTSTPAPTGAKRNSARDVFFLILKIIFFPVTLIVLGVLKLFKRFKAGITVKTTVVFTVVFGLMIIGYCAFILISVAANIRSGEADESYIRRLIITSVILVAVFIVLGSAIGGLSSQFMINPVRKITDKVREISEDNLASAHIDTVDTQDELMELVEQINNMLDSLKQAFERQENFVSDASHELKTPLAVIAGYANLLRRWGKDDPKILDESVEAISRESENMKRIVEQLLWLAKLGNFSLNNTVFNLYETVDDIVQGYKTVNVKHSVTLEGDASVTLNTDKNLMTEAVRTLVDNAIKYTPPDGGKIKITITRFSDRIELCVSDNGVGISDADKEHIFERFYRCDKARGRESGSSGLGLTICKSIVEMMGGNIAVDSVLGEGSRFTITLY